MTEGDGILDLVTVINNDQIVVSSRHVAERFGKQHPHVVRDIESLITTLSKNGEASHDAGFYKGQEYFLKKFLKNKTGLHNHGIAIQTALQGVD